MTVRGLVSGLLTGACALVWAATAAASPSGVVVSQVYGGGGNSGATYTHDFVELYNAGSTDVSLAGWSVQYAIGRPARAGTVTTTHRHDRGRAFLPRPTGAGRGRNDAAADTRRNRHGSRWRRARARSRSSAQHRCRGRHRLPAALWRDRGLRRVRHRDERRELLRGHGCRTDARRTDVAALRGGSGAIDTDNNASDFVTGAPNPRNSQFGEPGDGAPTVQAVTPANGATEVARTTNLTVTFNEAVNAAAGAFTLMCAQTGARTLAVTGDGTASYTLDPTADLGEGETCTATVQRGRHLRRRRDRSARRDGSRLHVVVHDDASAPDQDDRRGAGRGLRHRRRQYPPLRVRARGGQRRGSDGDACAA